MPNYRAPKIKTKLGNDPTIGPLVAAIMIGNSGGHDKCLQVVPIRTDYLPGIDQNRKHVHLHNHEVAVYAANLVSYSFIVYGFNNGHFINSSSSLPMQVAMAADIRPCGRAMFKKHTTCPRICDSAASLLQGIAGSKAKSTIHCYLVHSHRFLKCATEQQLWSTQIAIIKHLRLSRNLICFCVLFTIVVIWL